MICAMQTKVAVSNCSSPYTVTLFQSITWAFRNAEVGRKLQWQYLRVIARLEFNDIFLYGPTAVFIPTNL